MLHDPRCVVDAATVQPQTTTAILIVVERGHTQRETPLTRDELPRRRGGDAARWVWLDAAHAIVGTVRYWQSAMLDLFITYGRQSEDDVRGLLEDLAALGDRVWCEAEQRSGAAWWEQTLSRVRSCDALLFALTPRTLESEACWRELQYAHALGKPVLAIELVERADLGVVPAPLGTVPFVNYRRRDRSSVLQLCKALRNVGKAAPLPAVLPAPPGLPPTYLAGLRERIASREKLDADQQSLLVAELTRDSRELHSAFEARQLLLALRQRRDLSARSIAEVDALLRKTAATQIKLRPPPGSLLPSRLARSAPPLVGSGAPGGAPERAAPPARRRLTTKRVLASLGGVVSCTAAGCLIANGASQDHGLEGLQVGQLEIPGIELVALLVVGAGIVGAFAKVSLVRALAIGACVALVALWLAVSGQPEDGGFVSSLLAAPAGLLLGTGLAAAWQVAVRRARPA